MKLPKALNGASAEPLSERDSVLREVEQVLRLARSVSLGPQFDDIIRTAVERATDRLMAATRRRTTRLAALAEVQQTVGGGFNLPVIMSGVYAHLREILDAPSFIVASYDVGLDALHIAFVAAEGQPVEIGRVPPLPLGDSLAERVIRGGRPIVSNDIMTDPAHTSRRMLTYSLSAEPVRSVVCVPMRRGEDVLGLMQAQSPRVGAYGEEEVEFLATIANQTAMAMENARLYQEALSRSREVEALLAAAQELGTELEPEPLLRRIVEAAAHLVDAELATIGLAVGGEAGQESRLVRGRLESGSVPRRSRLRLRFGDIWADGVWRPLGAAVETDEATVRSWATGRQSLATEPSRDPAASLLGALPPLRSRLVVPVLGRDRSVLGVIALFNKRERDDFTQRDVDITTAFASHAAMPLERANAYRTVAQSRNYLQTLMDLSQVAIFVLDPARGRVRDINADGARLLGCEREEALRLRLADIAPSGDHAGWEALLREAPDGGRVIERELHLLARDGSPVPLDVSATRLYLDDAPALVCLCRDRRPRQRREEAGRLRALGEMASGVAHDFNNMLGVIVGRTELLLARGALLDEQARADVEVIRQAARDGAETVKRLQAFSGVSRLTQHDVADVNRVLSDAVEFTRARWRDDAQQRGVTIEVTIEAGEVPPAEASASELREVLVNMIFNAVDAMPHGGRMTLRSWARGDRVYISVADTGIGMSEAVKSRAFEPFFTTKGSRGSGLGLSASYGIISRMGGQITVESAPYQGTTFTIELPVGEQAPETPAPVATPFRPLSLLLVDDEPQMLLTTQMMLEVEGHRITAVKSGQEALTAVERAPFDAVLTDLGMPEMNGLQLTELLRARGFTNPVLLITGWGMELEAERVQAVGVTDILPKPFDNEKLRAKLAAIAGATPSGVALSTAG